METTQPDKLQSVVRSLREYDWRALVPPRWAWLRLLASPTSYILIITLVMVVWAKGTTLRDLEGVGFWPLLLVWAMASDVLVHFVFAAMFAVGEARSPYVLFATVPLTLLIAFFAVSNAVYLGITGEQLTWEAITLGVDRFADLKSILAEQMRNRGWFNTFIHGALATGIPLGIRHLLIKYKGRVEPVQRSRERALCAAWVVVIASAFWLVAPSADSLAVARLRHNATMDTYWSWLFDEDPVKKTAGDVEFDGFEPPYMVSLRAVKQLASRSDKPNVVVIVLESARYDHTSLAGAGAKAKTPHLAALAARGSVVRTTRAVLPHTTKSLFSILCGRMPLMQKTIVEISEATVIQCLPDIANRGGYSTAFFQSALGVFEFRPRLVDKLGFRHFEAWEDIKGETLGYLASDDVSMAAPFGRWLDDHLLRKPKAPFFTTLLTSAAHHPYRLPKHLAELADKTGAATSSAADKYARLVEGSDILVGNVVEALRSRNLIDNTIIVVAGDHGEGFGAKGVRQHDNNFYEEGLRVPLVFAGPGVPVGDINGNASLVDVAPSLLHLLNVPIADKAKPDIDGLNLFDPIDVARLDTTPRYFSCFYEQRCRGFVLGQRKVVYIPQRDTARYFDLAADPDERDAKSLPDDLAGRLDAMHRALNAHLTRSWPLKLGPIKPLERWQCLPGKVCTHPEAPKSGFFEPPGD